MSIEIRTPQPIDLTPYRVLVGDTVQFIEKINGLQDAMEAWTEQDWENFVTDVSAAMDEQQTTVQQIADDLELTVQQIADETRDWRDEAEEFAAIASTAFKYMHVWDVVDGNPPIPMNNGEPISGFYTVNGDGVLYGITFISGDEIVYEVDSETWRRVARQRSATADRDKTNNVDLFLARGMKEHIESGDHDQRYARIPAGTRMLFQQTVAPTGWTKVTEHNNKALRVVSGTVGSGGSNAFTEAFNSNRTTTSNGAHTHDITVNNHTLSVSQIPSHTHGMRARSTTGGSSGAFENRNPTGTTLSSGEAGGSGAHNHGASSGSAGAHTHTLNLDVQYVDVIIAERA